MTIDTTVDVDVDMEDFDDGELIDELEERGYRVYSPNDPEEPLLSKHECEVVLNLIGWDQRPGSEMHSIVEKLSRMYYGRL